MIWTDAREVAEIVDRIGPVIISTTTATSTQEAVDLRRAVGRLMASDNIELATFVADMMNCLNLARLAGASLSAMGRVRKAALAETPVSETATAVVLATVRLSLAQEARIVSQIEFTSRQDVDAVFSDINAAFVAAAEVASDELDASTYIAIITLQADVVRHLTEEGRELPRVINYTVAKTVPALTLSQRFYGAADRSDQLREENKVVHPAFMPSAGRMLAV